jgi:hypothetical protein
MQAAPMQAAPQDVGASIPEYFDASKGTDEAKFPAHYSDDVVLQLPPGTLDGLNALVFLIAEGSFTEHGVTKNRRPHQSQFSSHIL